MAKPKLALIPAAQGDKFYSVLPSSGVGDFDFTRSGGATRINSQGLIETVADGVSRLNYPLIDGKVVGCPSHLLEPSSTNNDSESTNFSTSFMSNSSGISSSVLTSEIAPDGSVNSVYKITKVTDNSDPYLGRSGVGFTSTSMVFSAWLWTDEDQPKDVLFLVYRDGAQEVQTKNITLTTTPTRYFIEASFATTPSNISYRIDLTPSSSNQYIYAWGKQLENGSYVTSYIPTNGTIQTRSAETANNSGDASTFNDSEGVLFWEGNYFEDKQGNGRRIGIINSDTSIFNRLVLTVGDVLGQIRVYVQGNNAFKNLTYVPQNILEHMKIAIYYDSINCKMIINGFEVDSDTVGDLFIGLDTLRFAGLGGGNHFEGNTKQVQYYDSALTDSELETLTSWVSFSDMAEGQLYTIE